ncbi:hypothetical protein PVL30_005469 [Lodderomyces elongisporus]|uniref:uncharacterized protein n=1 Tax=Lodderomyces elongisporus TaxID=36914 RepID=UPI002921C10A|nr:uncharacterized protein PVL30_005469 [Lodderomyces elongisporus]WLF81670.1 hypothetical protein PVL30_005469 [Lodderomyces elongisporus]
MSVLGRQSAGNTTATTATATATSTSTVPPPPPQPSSNTTSTIKSTSNLRSLSALPTLKDNLQNCAFASLPVTPSLPTPTTPTHSTTLKQCFTKNFAFFAEYNGGRTSAAGEEYEDFADFEEEEDESESIISEAYSILTPDLSISRNQERNINEDTIAAAAFLSDVKQTFPSITNPKQSASQILASFFSTEVFYANSLLQLRQHFINQEFDSFSHDFVLNPNILTLKHHHHPLIIEKLDALYISSVELVSVITMFNCFLKKINAHDVTLTNLKHIKSRLDQLVENNLSQLVHGILDVIIDGLYEYNLMIEEMIEEDKSEKEDGKEETSCESLDVIKGYYHELETTLTLNNAKLSQQACESFYKLLHDDIIEDKKWVSYIEYLKTIV